MTCPTCADLGVCPEHDLNIGLEMSRLVCNTPESFVSPGRQHQTPAHGAEITEQEGADVQSSRGGGDAPAAELCYHCDERPGGAEGTVWCQGCLEMYREDYLTGRW